MKIKKTFQGELPENRVVNAKSNSATDAYSANYLNDKLNKVVVSPTEPTTGEDVWIKRSSNILKFDDFTETVNGITFTMKDQVLHVEGTATAYTQSCYISVDLTLEEAMTLTVDWDDDNLIPKAAYTYDGTSYYPNLYSQELEPGTYLNKLYFIIASGATVNTDVRFQLERGRGFSGWQPVMEKAILVKNDNDVYEDLIKKSIHVGVNKPKNGEDVWVQKSNNMFPGWNVGQHYGSSNGTLVTGSTSSCSPLIPVDFKNKQKYHFSNFPTNANIYISAFDSKGVYVGRTSSGVKSDYTFYPDRLSSSGGGSGDANDISFISVTYMGTDVNANTMLNFGTDALLYEPYVETKIHTKNNIGGYSSSNNVNVYSTEEQRIGTWIDGKPLYRKIISFNITSEEEYTVEHNISNVDNIFIDCNSFLTSKGVSSLPLTTPSKSITDDYSYNKHYTRVSVTPTQVKAHIGGYTHSGWGNVYVILNYTKLTD